MTGDVYDPRRPEPVEVDALDEDADTRGSVVLVPWRPALAAVGLLVLAGVGGVAFHARFAPTMTVPLPPPAAVASPPSSSSSASPSSQPPTLPPAASSPGGWQVSAPTPTASTVTTTATVTRTRRIVDVRTRWQVERRTVAGPTVTRTAPPPPPPPPVTVTSHHHHTAPAPPPVTRTRTVHIHHTVRPPRRTVTTTVRIPAR